jgi:hypothetical protein
MKVQAFRVISPAHAFFRRRKRQERNLQTFYRLYGVPGEVYLEQMDKFDFAPGAVDEMMAHIEEAFERGYGDTK